jgi:hypothetical protein
VDEQSMVFAQRLFEAEGDVAVTRVLHQLTFGTDADAPPSLELNLATASHLAAHTTDPHELAVLATDPRPQVVTAVATNPATDVDVLSRIVAIALAADPHPAYLRATLDRLPVEQACAAIAAAGPDAAWLVHGLHQRVIRDGIDPARAVDALEAAAASPALVHEFAVLVTGRLSGRRLELFGARVGGDVELRALLTAVVGGSLKLTRVRAERIAALAGTLTDDQSEALRLLLPARPGTAVLHRTAPGAAAALAALTHPLTIELAVQATDDPQILATLAARCDDDQLPELAAAAGAAAAVDAIKTVLHRISFGVSAGLAGDVVNALVGGLRDRHADGADIGQVVTTALTTRAADQLWRGEHVLAFVCETDPAVAPPPGWAAALPAAAATELFWEALDELRCQPDGPNSQVLPPAVAELVDVVPGLTGHDELLDEHPRVAAAIVDRIRATFTRQFGADLAAWEVATTLAPTFDGSVLELARAAQLLAGSTDLADAA